jgi:hypothetical protein
LRKNGKASAPAKGLERFPDAEDLTERLDRLSVTIEETP